MKKNASQGQIHHFPRLVLEDSAGRIARELWWTNQEFSAVDIIQLWFFLLICLLGDEQ
jgi:hypothetical protein